MAKSFARPRTNTVGFEDGVLSEVVAAEMHALHRWLPTPGLRDPTKVPHRVYKAVMSLAPDFGDTMMYARLAVVSSGRTCVCGDVVVYMLGGSICIGEVLAHVSQADM